MSENADIGRSAEVRRTFARSRGVPPALISGVFEELAIEAATQARFWTALLKKNIRFERGMIRKIQVEPDGRTGLFLDHGGLGTWLYAPDEVDDGQFDALKNAFERGFMVDVFWVINNHGDLHVIYVEVEVPSPHPEA